MSKDKKQSAAAGKAEDTKNEQTSEPVAETKETAVASEESKTEIPAEKPENTAETEKQEPKEELKIEKQSLEDDLAALTDRYLRVCAEYDNFRKRSQKERDSLYGDVKADVLIKFLPVYDNLIRALAQSTDDEAYLKGVELIMAQFNSTLEKLGVSEIDCLGKQFDPAFHNAVMHVDDEEKGENEIVEVFQKGFIMGERVIRFSMVKVAN